MQTINQTRPKLATGTTTPRRTNVAQLVKQRLSSNSYLSLRQIRCEHHEGVLILRGTVPSYYLKQVAQALVAEIEGVDEIVNKLDVVPPADRGRNAGDSRRN